MWWIFDKIRALGEIIILALALVIFIKAILVPNALDIIILVVLLVYFIACVCRNRPVC
ncbi:MAG: hypothetical protein ACM3WV_10145 [Bacillota bacterium]